MTGSRRDSAGRTEPRDPLSIDPEKAGADRFATRRGRRGVVCILAVLVIAGLSVTVNSWGA